MKGVDRKPLKTNQRDTNTQINHQNPCQTKIMYPLLRSNNITRHQSLTPLITPKPNSTQKKRYQSSQKYKQTQNKEYFLHRCYQQVAIQNSCLFKQLQNKANELNQLKKQISNRRGDFQLQEQWMSIDNPLTSLDRIEEESLSSKESLLRENNLAEREGKSRFEGFQMTRAAQLRRKKHI